MSQTMCKPWGSEFIWAATDKYVGKILYIRAGRRLSMQYHKVKDETVMLINGQAMIETIAGEYPLSKHSPLHIPPGATHRIRAITDSEILEVSTSELDDVVRLEDDYNRAEQ